MPLTDVLERTWRSATTPEPGPRHSTHAEWPMQCHRQRAMLVQRWLPWPWRWRANTVRPWCVTSRAKARGRAHAFALLASAKWQELRAEPKRVEFHRLATRPRTPPGGGARRSSAAGGDAHESGQRRRPRRRGTAAAHRLTARPDAFIRDRPRYRMSRHARAGAIAWRTQRSARLRGFALRPARDRPQQSPHPRARPDGRRARAVAAADEK